MKTIEIILMFLLMAAGLLFIFYPPLLKEFAEDGTRPERKTINDKDFCPVCGHRITAGDRFCSQCGTAL